MIRKAPKKTLAIVSTLIVLFALIWPVRAAIQATTGRQEAAPSPTTRAGATKALFVVGSMQLSAGDAAIKQRLERMRFSVTVKDGAGAATTDANGQTVVIVSSTVNPDDVNTKFRDVKVPLVTWEAGLFDDLGMTATEETVDYGWAANQKQVSIVTPGKPFKPVITDTLPLTPTIAPEKPGKVLSGTLMVSTKPITMSWGMPGPKAIKVA
jgi:hypothetical protein